MVSHRFDHEVAFRALGDSAVANTKSMHFSSVIAAVLQTQVYKTAKDDEYELWDARASRWRKVKTSGLFERVQAELLQIFAPRAPRRPGETPHVYPVPLGTDTFVNARCQYVAKLSDHSSTHPLDSDYRFRLLFPADAKNSKSVSHLYDFRTDALRAVQASDRLYLHTKWPYSEFLPEPNVQQAFESFRDALLQHTKDGTGLVDEGDDEVCIRIRRLFASVLLHPQRPSLVCGCGQAVGEGLVGRYVSRA